MVPDEVELPEEPVAPTLDELRAYAREVSEVMAKKVDDHYRTAHLYTSAISSTKDSSKLMQALAIDGLDALDDTELVESVETIAKPYESQYKSLYLECCKHLGDNTSADEKDTSKILELAEKWADAKIAASDEQLGEQISLE